MGNLLWLGVLPAEQREALPAAISAISAQGYWASPFPEGDGVTFKRYRGTPYDPDAALTDFQAAFAFLYVEALDPGERQACALARLAGDRKITCTCLVPVEGLRLQVLRDHFDEPASKVPTRTMPDWLVRLLALFSKDMAALAPELGVAYTADAAKAARILGWTTRSAERSIIDAAESLLGRNLV